MCEQKVCWDKIVEVSTIDICVFTYTDSSSSAYICSHLACQVGNKIRKNHLSESLTIEWFISFLITSIVYCYNKSCQTKNSKLPTNFCSLP